MTIFDYLVIFVLVTSVIIGLVRGARVSGEATPLIYLNGQYQ